MRCPRSALETVLETTLSATGVVFVALQPKALRVLAVTPTEDAFTIALRYIAASGRFPLHTPNTLYRPYAPLSSLTKFICPTPMHAFFTPLHYIYFSLRFSLQYLPQTQHLCLPHESLPLSHKPSIT